MDELPSSRKEIASASELSRVTLDSIKPSGACRPGKSSCSRRTGLELTSERRDRATSTFLGLACFVRRPAKAPAPLSLGIASSTIASSATTSPITGSSSGSPSRTFLPGRFLVWSGLVQLLRAGADRLHILRRLPSAAQSLIPPRLIKDQG